EEKRAGLSVMQTRLASIAAARDNLDWLVRAKPEANERQTASLRADAERKRAEAQLVEARLGVARLTTQRDVALKSVAVLEGGAQELERRLKALSEVERTILQWEEVTAQREKLAAQRSSIELALKTTRQGEIEAAAEIAGLTPRLRASERAVTGLEKARSEHEKLLDSALDHVQGCSCPVCGKEYSTRQELTERIRRLRGTLTPELESARNELAQVRTRIKALGACRRTTAVCNVTVRWSSNGYGHSTFPRLLS
ncbi:MAG: hypothetical protein NTX53_19210, partial [candidate division WOR-3 bacterium]|nr:hypothetical protein [candidate division WOR-3 bacterium]